MKDSLKKNNLSHGQLANRRGLKPPKKTVTPSPLSVQKKRLQETSDALKKSLNQWEEISSTSIKPTAEEQMMNDLKGLLSKLKNQMDDFE